MKPAYFSVFFSLSDFKSLANAEVGETRVGPARVYDGFKWNLMAMLKASSPTRRLGLYLQSAGVGASSYKAEVNLRVVNYGRPSSDIVNCAGVHTFRREAFDWGFDGMADIAVSYFVILPVA